MQNCMDTSNPISSGSKSGSDFVMGQRVHFVGDTRRIGTVKYVGEVEGYEGNWVGVDWENADGKHDGSHNGVRYFQAQGPKTASFVRPHNLSSGFPLLKALEFRYHGQSTKQEEEEMYVLSATNKKVSIELLGKDKIQNKLSRFDELTSASLAYLGVSLAGPPGQINATIPRLKELDLTGNLLSDWREIAGICIELPALVTLNLSYNIMSHDVSGMPVLNHIKVVVLNHTGISWKQVEMLKDSLPLVEELHLRGNKLRRITDIRLSENPIADPGRGGVPRFVLIARLAKVEILNGSQVSPRERKESEIRYVRLVMSKCHDNPEETKKLHPRFAELKTFHGIEDEKAASGATGPQKMSLSLISITLKCVAASIGEKAPLTKKLPATTTVGKLKILCESFFKIKSIKPKLFLQEEGSPLPTLLDDDMASIIDFGVGNGSTILVEEEC
ncbi:tubulin-folding cofactor E isoform X3 [Lycium barbarum]|uniref:tubulin-folding cofactor E isoform X3 n=1 Tax=Lycium barbarum TaxID=112863 RepID=UPI00293E4698|nr:tubulin-folding cofactor E isoform X3 [Lycium barbarum]